MLGVADLDSATAWLAEQGLTALPRSASALGHSNRDRAAGLGVPRAGRRRRPRRRGRQCLRILGRGPGPGRRRLGLGGVRPHDIAATAERLDLDLVPGSRVRPDGVTLSWRRGVPDESSDRSLPFFIAWGDGVPMPGAAPVTHDAGTVRLRGLTVGGDEAVLHDWLGDEIDGVVVTPGRAGVLAVVLTTPSAEITLRPPLAEHRP